MKSFWATRSSVRKEIFDISETDPEALQRYVAVTQLLNKVPKLTLVFPILTHRPT